MTFLASHLPGGWPTTYRGFLGPVQTSPALHAPIDTRLDHSSRDVNHGTPDGITRPEMPIAAHPMCRRSQNLHRREVLAAGKSTQHTC